MMFPKQKRTVNKKLIKSIKAIGFCERCGSSFCLETHHIKSRGTRWEYKPGRAKEDY